MNVIYVRSLYDGWKIHVKKDEMYWHVYSGKYTDFLCYHDGKKAADTVDGKTKKILNRVRFPCIEANKCWFQVVIQSKTFYFNTSSRLIYISFDIQALLPKYILLKQLLYCKDLYPSMMITLLCLFVTSYDFDSMSFLVCNYADWKSQECSAFNHLDKRIFLELLQFY